MIMKKDNDIIDIDTYLRESFTTSLEEVDWILVPRTNKLIFKNLHGHANG